MIRVNLILIAPLTGVLWSLARLGLRPKPWHPAPLTGVLWSLARLGLCPKPWHPA